MSLPNLYVELITSCCKYLYLLIYYKKYVSNVEFWDFQFNSIEWYILNDSSYVALEHYSHVLYAHLLLYNLDLHVFWIIAQVCWWKNDRDLRMITECMAGTSLVGNLSQFTNSYYVSLI